MLVYRACKQAHVCQLDGEGARQCGGRWNSPGIPVVYCASSRSLAILETIVNVGSVDLIPDDYMMLEINIPDGISAATVQYEELTAGFLLAETRKMGDRWMKSCNSAILIVPSKVVCQEQNILINPAHPSATQISVTNQQSFKELDKRLFK